MISTLYKFLMKYGNVVALLFAVLIIIKFALDFTLGLHSKGMDASTDLVPVKNDINFFNFTLYLTVYLMFFAIFVWLLVEAINLLLNLKGSYKFLVSFIVVVIVYFIFYSSANANEGGRMAELLADPVYNLTPSVSKHISAGLWTTVSLIFISIIVFVGSEIIGMFK